MSGYPGDVLRATRNSLAKANGSWAGRAMRTLMRRRSSVVAVVVDRQCLISVPIKVISVAVITAMISLSLSVGVAVAVHTVRVRPGLTTSAEAR